ncbi:hypothetical protein [Herbaspirillum sp. 3R-11]|uniref:hypothetical protein n=1 Tax=Herbaspirillum sp. 3R-11 TaxID=2559616 RepID=UPI001103E13A|nr:hypothetical protein [Herbaspirillum sp. 3R-11]TFI07411.1 hypothetical protein E4P32_16090 [Herbaspirillum sp. 3R11]
MTSAAPCPGATQNHHKNFHPTAIAKAKAVLIHSRPVARLDLCAGVALTSIDCLIQVTQDSWPCPALALLLAGISPTSGARLKMAAVVALVCTSPRYASFFRHFLSP